MPFTLHPSGYCIWFNYPKGNLKIQEPCGECGRVAGHSVECPAYVVSDKGKNSRAKLYDSSAILWARDKDKSFVTFTLPSRGHGIYQSYVDCPVTGDIAVAEKFSKVMEAWAVRQKRRGHRFSYVWVSEAQMKRQEKFGGVGDLHYHLLVNTRIKSDRGRVVDRETLEWVQSLWCEHLGADALNCLHVDPVPDDARSIPAYLAKYLGKGAQRPIRSRRYAATRDLTRFKPITLSKLPEATLEHSRGFTTPTGHDIEMYFYNTREVLELYGAHMADEGLLA